MNVGKVKAVLRSLSVSHSFTILNELLVCPFRVGLNISPNHQVGRRLGKVRPSTQMNIVPYRLFEFPPLDHIFANKDNRMFKLHNYLFFMSSMNAGQVKGVFHSLSVCHTFTILD